MFENTSNNNKVTKKLKQIFKYYLHAVFHIHLLFKNVFAFLFFLLKYIETACF